MHILRCWNSSRKVISVTTNSNYYTRKNYTVSFPLHLNFGVIVILNIFSNLSFCKRLQQNYYNLKPIIRFLRPQLSKLQCDFKTVVTPLWPPSTLQMYIDWENHKRNHTCTCLHAFNTFLYHAGTWYVVHACIFF